MSCVILIWDRYKFQISEYVLNEVIEYSNISKCFVIQDVSVTTSYHRVTIVIHVQYLGALFNVFRRNNDVKQGTCNLIFSKSGSVEQCARLRHSKSEHCTGRQRNTLFFCYSTLSQYVFFFNLLFQIRRKKRTCCKKSLTWSQTLSLVSN